MLGFGAIGEFAIGEAGPLPARIADSADKVTLAISSLIIPDKLVHEGVLIKSTSVIWAEIVEKLDADWSVAYQLPADKWEEIVAGAFKKDGYDDVILTPR